MKVAGNGKPNDPHLDDRSLFACHTSNVAAIMVNVLHVAVLAREGQGDALYIFTLAIIHDTKNTCQDKPE